ncbi:MAG: ATP-binding cassette domain-containing protein [Ruminococcaceae bacterium]|nr:ATP-binding cassette domain-containing protein [Oscillospiraceae bacterium]
MDELMIKVSDVTKEYRLGAIGGTTLREELQRRRAKRKHLEDPTLKIGETRADSNERFMALNGVSFEVKKGEAVGIIGHNGAGKSTLLKLITRITAPTTGDIYLNGRVASMLEVGTGFHQELTGRENVYLNGAILGMTKKEIDAKMEDIIEFSEVRQFIDTPVKRYSSGMYVKLAFSVAAHLDSEIMIMDEVLAVGDVAFQNKCIQKMREVADSGKTILYVSHNMATIRALCDRCIVLDHGQTVYDGDVNTAIGIYMKVADDAEKIYYGPDDLLRGNHCTLEHKLHSVEILDSNTNHFMYGDLIKIRLGWESPDSDANLELKVLFINSARGVVGGSFLGKLEHSEGLNYADITIDTRYFVPGSYFLNLKLYNQIDQGNVITYDTCEALAFTVEHSEKSIHLREWYNNWGSAVLPCLRHVEEKE